jgi:hypothetical protein
MRKRSLGPERLRAPPSRIRLIHCPSFVLCLNLLLVRSVDIAMVVKAGGHDALYINMQHAAEAQIAHARPIRGKPLCVYGPRASPPA